jgi:N-acetylglucosaminyl-diphospho-decaprenol L-rhamnosyltransferase
VVQAFSVPEMDTKTPLQQGADDNRGGQDPALNKVAAIIINRNTGDFLRTCLASITEQEFNGGISLWVVDNGSTDGSQEMVLSEFPDANLVWNEKNVGYARACNQGARHTDTPFLFFMNSDTVLTAGTTQELVDYFEENPRAGVLGPRILNSDGSLQYSCREFPSVMDAFLHAFVGLFSAKNPASARYKKTDWEHEDEAEVDWVSGCFIAVRRETFNALGGFDENYYMYVEDVDLCWRSWVAGWSVHYLPRGDVYHHIGMSSQAVPARMVFHHHSGMLRFHRNTYQGGARPLVTAFVAAGVVTRFLLIMALNGFYRLRAALGGVKRVIMPGRQ